MPMDEEQRAALKESVEHWERLASGQCQEGENPFGSWCACCKLGEKRSALLVDPDDEDDFPPGKHYCWGCPIFETTGRSECGGTPWEDAAKEWHSHGNTAEFRAAAEKELAFLRSLLEEGNE